MKAPLVSRPQKWVKPRNVKVSGFPSPRCFRSRAANRPNSISRVLSGCNSKPNFASRSRNSFRGIAQHPFGAESHYKIVSIADDDYVALCHFLAPDISPYIEEVMQLHVGDQR